MSGHADRDRGRRPGRAVSLDPPEAAGPGARGRRPRAQRARRHVRLRRRVLRRDAGGVRGRRPGVLRGDHARASCAGARSTCTSAARSSPAAGTASRRSGARSCSTSCSARAASLGVDLRFRHEVSALEGDLVVAADGVNSHAARALRLRARRWTAAARPTPGSAPTHVFDVVHVPDRRDPARRRAGPRLSVQRLDEHVHRRDDGRRCALDKAACEALFGYRLIENRTRWINFVTVRNPFWRARERRPARRRRAHRALLDRLGHEARDGGRDLARVGGAGGRHRRLRGRAPADRGEPRSARRRARWSGSRGSGATCTRTRGRSRSTCSRARAGSRTASCACATRTSSPRWATRRRCSRRSGCASLELAQPRRRLADGHVLLGRRHAGRLPPRAPRRAGDRRRRAGDDRDDLHVSADGRITPGCGGLYRDEHMAAWKRIVDFVHAHSRAAIGASSGTRGARARRKLLWEGEDEPLRRRQLAADRAVAAPVVSRRQPGAARDDPRGHGRGAWPSSWPRRERADAAGFDLLEIHMAHGYLLLELPVAADQRARRRVRRGPREVPARGVRRVPRGVAGREADVACASARPTGSTGGFDGDDAVAFARRLVEAGCDIVDVSTGQVSPDQKPAYGRSLPDAVRRPDPPRGGHPGDRGRRDLQLRRRQHDHPRRPRRPVRAGAPAPVGPALDAARRRRPGRRRCRWIPQYRSGVARAATPARTCGGCRCGASIGVPGVRTVVVTGGKRGIGAAICAALRRRARGRAVQRRPRRDRRGRGRARVRRARSRRRARQQRRRVLERAAASARRSTSGSASSRVNATGAFLCTRAVLRRDARARPRPDRHRRLGRRARRLALHVRLHGVQARGARADARGRGRGRGHRRHRNAVCPAYVRSDMTDATIANIEARTGQDGEAALAAMAPLGRLIEPEEVAFAVRFFAAAGGGGDQRPDADHRRGRGAAVSRVRLGGARRRRVRDADRRGAQEPADVRVLRRAARPLPRAGLRRRRSRSS